MSTSRPSSHRWIQDRPPPWHLMEHVLSGGMSRHSSTSTPSSTPFALINKTDIRQGCHTIILPQIFKFDLINPNRPNELKPWVLSSMPSWVAALRLPIVREIDAIMLVTSKFLCVCASLLIHMII